MWPGKEKKGKKIHSKKKRNEKLSFICFVCCFDFDFNLNFDFNFIWEQQQNKTSWDCPYDVGDHRYFFSFLFFSFRFYDGKFGSLGHLDTSWFIFIYLDQLYFFIDNIEGVASKSKFWTIVSLSFFYIVFYLFSMEPNETNT